MVSLLLQMLLYIKDRQFRISAAIREVKSIVDDCRLQIVGGALAGLEIWEIALIPSILTNAETWVNLNEKSLINLESLQNFMFRCLLSTPKSTPPSFLLWDLGCLKMKNRIIKKKS